MPIKCGSTDPNNTTKVPDFIRFQVTAVIDHGEVSIASLGGDYPMLTGNLFAILGSGLIVFVYTYFISSEKYDFEGTRNISIVDGNKVQYANKEETDPQVIHQDSLVCVLRKSPYFQKRLCFRKESLKLTQPF